MKLKNKQIYGRFLGQPISARNLFANLPIKTKKKLTSIRQQKKIHEGELISRLGDFPESILIFQNGKAQLTIKNNLSHKENTRCVENKEIIGLTQIISNSPNEMNVVALSPCLLDSYSAQDFLNFLQNDPQLCFRLTKILTLDIEAGYHKFLETNF